MEIMHEYNTHNFPLNSAVIEVPSTNGYDFNLNVHNIFKKNIIFNFLFYQGIGIA